MTDPAVLAIGTSMLLLGVPILAVSLIGLGALWRDERRQRRAAEARMHIDRQARMAARRIRAQYDDATRLAIRYAMAKQPPDSTER